MFSTPLSVSPFPTHPRVLEVHINDIRDITTHTSYSENHDSILILVFYYFFMSPLQTSSISLLRVILFRSVLLSMSLNHKKIVLMYHRLAAQCQWTRVFVSLTTPMAMGTELGLKWHQESHYSSHCSRKLWFRHYYQWLFLQVAMLAKKCLEPLPIPETNDHNGSGGGTNCGHFTFHQHNIIR